MRRTGRFRFDPEVEPAYAGLKARIIARTGHAYYADKDELLLERLYRRLRATGVPDLAAYHSLLADGVAGESEWARLEAEITIGETFFFRYSEQFAALRGTILPGLVAARRAERRLRIWSAGCSTGAEPYSLAILVREILGEALPDWRVSILGTDISAEAIATARAGDYGRWALRTMPPEERLRYFTHLPPEPGIRREGGFALRPEFRQMVQFKQGNLLAVVEPPGNEEGYDLILCRNVLIYFDAATVTRVVHGLGRRLRPEGWLLLGHAEPNPTFSAFLDPVSLPGTVAYRPGGTLAANVTFQAPSIETPTSFPAPDPEGPAWTGLEAGLRGSQSLPEPPLAVAPLNLVMSEVEGSEGNSDELPFDTLPEDPLDRVRVLADAGETGAAWRAVRDALDADPTHPRLRFYEGLVAASLGREVEAERALRASLYLDRSFVMAHYHLGLLLLGLGRRAEAARALDNAFALSQSLPPDAVLPEGDGALASEVAAGVEAALGRSGKTMRGRA
ncbi:CheR family methyltransferase [Methylobacterium sp. NFXW15]|uniref:CheR family methyltransferase n=1 Tax=Methylobacterium sp. NFXW15 TaxID=2819512 RepID=UPI003CE73C1D